MEHQNGFFEFIKNVLAGALIVVATFMLSFAFVGFAILIPFVLFSLYGMIFIRPHLSDTRDIRTCWFSLAKFYISMTLQLGIGAVILLVFGAASIFCITLMVEGMIVLPGLFLAGCVWIIIGYFKQLFAKGTNGNRECFRLALAGRF